MSRRAKKQGGFRSRGKIGRKGENRQSAGKPYPFSGRYRPAFQIDGESVSSGGIRPIGRDDLRFGESAERYIRFLTPEAGPHSLWIGKKLPFMEEKSVTDEAVIEEIRNPLLLK